MAKFRISYTDAEGKQHSKSYDDEDKAIDDFLKIKKLQKKYNLTEIRLTDGVTMYIPGFGWD